MNLSFKELEQQLAQCRIADRYLLKKRWQQYCEQETNHTSPLWMCWRQDLERSQQSVAARCSQKPSIQYPEHLPVVERRAEILKALERHSVVIIAGETGSGKTTQLPKLCLELGRGMFGMIGHTQPRRLAARMVAQRIAEELQSPLGQWVGYQVRFQDQVTEHTYIKLMTDGILLAEIEQDRFLEKYDTIIIDEAHERSLNIDFLLGYIKRILPKRPDLKIIITSATIDVERFSQHFDQAPIIEVSGRTYPVDIIYSEPAHDKEETSSDVEDQVLDAVNAIIELENKDKVSILGDILVFLAGERDIRNVAQRLRKAMLRDTEILPLYARLTHAEQNKVFAPHSGRRIVLATNVAETSLTVPGIRYVIDPGWVRLSRYSYRNKVQRLPIEPISQASANQRAGRCGRVAAGICFRLYSESDFLNRAAFTDPEITRTDLASVILRMLSLRLGDIEAFPFLEPPDSRYIKDGFKTLFELGAIDQKNRLTRLGAKLAKLPIDVRLGRIILAAAHENCLQEILIIVSALSIQDPRERPLDAQQKADESHRQYWHTDSDFLSWVNLWNDYEEQRQNLTQNQLKQFCRIRFLSYMRMKEWREIHTQLKMACHDLQLKENTHNASYESVHRALITGFLNSVGFKTEESDYIGSRNRKFNITHTSSQAKKQPKWVVAAELVETHRLFARMVAKIDPSWIEPLALHLIKKHHFEPHWEKRRGQVVAFEQVSLYGLVLIPRRKINFGLLDEIEARNIFIQSALVENQLENPPSFLKQNYALLDEVTELESKSRKRDIVVEAKVLFDFYDEKISESVFDGASLKRWLNTLSATQLDQLHFTREDLIKRDTQHVSSADYPDVLLCKGIRFPLTYYFHPGDPEDGVTVTVPTIALSQLTTHALDWLVPGMLQAKCEALLRSLPKQWRKNFVPIPDFVQAIMESLVAQDEDLLTVLTQRLNKMTGVNVPRDAWQLAQLDAHHFMNIKVVDTEGQLLAMSRQLETLQTQYASTTAITVASASRTMTYWDIGELPKTVEYHEQGITLTLYPGLVDQKKQVAYQLFDDPSEAQRNTRLAVGRLLQLRMHNYLKSVEPSLALNEVKLLYSKVGQSNSFWDDFVMAAILCVLDEFHLPTAAAEFDQSYEYVCEHWFEAAQQLKKILQETLLMYAKIAKHWQGRMAPESMFALTDIKKQISILFEKDFLYTTPWQWLKQYPRYFKALIFRLEKLSSQFMKDRQHVLELDHWWRQYTLLSKYQYHEAVILFRWMIEEYRVSLFAQQLGTYMPISGKRLEQHYASLLASVR